MRLFLVRHAEAEPGEPDELRPLTAGGRDSARRLGKTLAPHGLDAVLCSPLLRARETAGEIARVAGLEAEPDERLAPGATAADVKAAIDGRGANVVVVGHQPDCSSIVLTLAGRKVPFAPAFVFAMDV